MQRLTALSAAGRRAGAPSQLVQHIQSPTLSWRGFPHGRRAPGRARPRLVMWTHLSTHTDTSYANTPATRRLRPAPALCRMYSLVCAMSRPAASSAPRVSTLSHRRSCTSAAAAAVCRSCSLSRSWRPPRALRPAPRTSLSQHPPMQGKPGSGDRTGARSPAGPPRTCILPPSVLRPRSATSTLWKNARSSFSLARTWAPQPRARRSSASSRQAGGAGRAGGPRLAKVGVVDHRLVPGRQREEEAQVPRAQRLQRLPAQNAFL